MTPLTRSLSDLTERWSLSARLMLAQGVVVSAGVLTAALVTGVAGPSVFHRHLVEAGHPADSPELQHVEDAYVTASTVALGTALLIALTAAGLVTWYQTRQVMRPLGRLIDVTRRLSGGDYTARAPRLGIGPELDELAATFNDVAQRLQTTEDTRRRLLTDLAHEMRTPVSTINAYLEGLEDGVTVWDLDTATVMREQARRLTRLADDLAEVSRAEEGRLRLTFEPDDACELARVAIQARRGEYVAKGVDLVGPGAESAVEGVLVAVDRPRILQILSNLLTNALRHTPAGGTVTVGVARAPGGVTITVEDTGDGISAQQLPHVFERFYRGDAARDRDHGGTGVGLTIALGLARAHGGSLEAASDGLGRGSTFRLLLPVAATGTGSSQDGHHTAR